MSISYNLNIPNGPDNPSTDQPNMKTNTNSISSFVAVDHVGFNTGAGNTSGRHLQVTFDSDNVPSLPTPTNGGDSLGILFTNTVGAGSINQLFYYAGPAAQSSNQYTNSSTNGSTMLLGGIILKWGKETLVGTQNPTVTFTNAFPNACFDVQLSLLNSGYSSATVAPVNVLLSQTGTSGTTGFTARVNQTGTGTWFWTAIGY